MTIPYGSAVGSIAVKFYLIIMNHITNAQFINMMSKFGIEKGNRGKGSQWSGYSHPERPSDKGRLQVTDQYSHRVYTSEDISYEPAKPFKFLVGEDFEEAGNRAGEHQIVEAYLNHLQRCYDEDVSIDWSNMGLVRKFLKCTEA